MGRFHPAFLGGLFLGALSGLPVVQAGNCCCCLWVVCGGLLTTYILQSRSAVPVETSEAILQGLVAGVIGAIVAGVVSLALMPVFGPFQREMMVRWLQQLQDSLPPEARSQFEEALQQQGQFSLAAEMLRSLMFIPIAAAFSTAGAALGLAFFRKKTPPQTPAQP
jgi:hypothetical protein